MVCQVVPGTVPDDFTSVERVRYRDADGVDTIGLAIPDLIEWYPVSALGEPVGVVADTVAVVRLVEALFR